MNFSGSVLSQVENYLEEILEALDFSALNDFLHQHMRTEMTFSEFVSQIAANGLDAMNKETITALVVDSFFYENGSRGLWRL